MPVKQKMRAIVAAPIATATALALAALSAAAVAVPAAHAADASYEGISASGEVAVFSTADSLVAGDTDFQRDVYVRAAEEGFGYVTREVSLGPTGGNDAYPAQFLSIDAAGEEVFFATEERLTSNDTDSAEDIYLRDLIDNETILVSAGGVSCLASGCGNANVDASATPGGFVDEGRRAFFVSSERLAAQDSDSSTDLYLRDLEAQTTTLVSVAGSPCSGSCGGGANSVFFQGAADDGSTAIFTTAEPLVSVDGDNLADLYVRDLGSGETELASAPGAGPEACPAGHNCEPANSGISADGSHVFFETIERIAGADDDESGDVYDWSGGAAILASVGPAGGDGADNALYAGSSADGGEAFFATEEQLVGADTDDAQDIYVRRGGSTTELVSAGDPSCAASSCGNGSGVALLQWISADGSFAVLSTAEPLTAADGDAKADVYSRQLPGGPTALVSLPGPTCTDPECGDGNHNAAFAGASAAGSHLFFVTEEALAPPAAGDPSSPGDRDAQTDVYQRSGGTTTLVSAGQLNGSGPYSGNGAFDAQPKGFSIAGDRAFIATKEQLTGEDSDAADDVYMRADGGTLLVSRGNDAALEEALAPPGPVLLGTDPKSPGAATTVRVVGSEPVEASIKLYASSDCSGEPVATGDGATLEDPGIAVTVGAGTTTTFRAVAEAGGFVSPCSGEVTYTQKTTAPPGGGSGGTQPQKPSAPAALEAEIDTVVKQLAPQSRITFGPAFKTRASRPVFRFTDATGQVGTRFICKLDRRRWQPCSSPTKLRRLDRGRHVFRVKGVNAEGVWEANSTKRAFKLVSR
jgi:hypothetical protein